MAFKIKTYPIKTFRLLFGIDGRPLDYLAFRKMCEEANIKVHNKKKYKKFLSPAEVKKFVALHGAPDEE